MTAVENPLTPHTHCARSARSEYPTITFIACMSTSTVGDQVLSIVHVGSYRYRTLAVPVSPVRVLLQVPVPTSMVPEWFGAALPVPTSGEPLK